MPPVEAPEGQRRVVTAAHLRAEVEQAVTRVDLPPPQREAIGARHVDARFAGHRGGVARLLDEPPLALAVEARRVRERGHLAAEPSLELAPAVADLVARGLLAEREQAGMRDGVGLEPQRPAAIER